MTTRKSVDKILDQAADVLEKRGFTTGMCFNPYTGGYCALGAIARAAYPKASDAAISTIAYNGVDFHDDHKADPRYVEAVRVAAATAARMKALPDAPNAGGIVYDYNDRTRSPKLVVKMLRRAAERARRAAVNV